MSDDSDGNDGGPMMKPVVARNNNPYAVKKRVPDLYRKPLEEFDNFEDEPVSMGSAATQKPTGSTNNNNATATSTTNANTGGSNNEAENINMDGSQKPKL